MRLKNMIAECPIGRQAEIIYGVGGGFNEAIKSIGSRNTAINASLNYRAMFRSYVGCHGAVVSFLASHHQSLLLFYTG